MKSLLERLDFLNNNMGSAIYEDADTCGEAAAAIRRLLVRNAELLEALREIEKLPGISSANLYARRAIAKAESEKENPGVL